MEARYGQSKLELYGLYQALQEYRVHLVGVPKLIVEMGALCIKGMINCPNPQNSDPLNRWIKGILMYDFKLVHIAGKKHKAPDALSHCWHTEADGGHKENPEESSDEDIPVHQMHPASEEKPPVRIGAAQQTDKEQDLHDIVHFLKTFKPPETTSTKQQQKFLNLATRHYLQEDQLYHQHPSGNNQKVLMTGKDRERILAKLHDGMGHHGEWAIWEAIRIWFYWPGIRKDVTQYVKSCHTCQLCSTKKMHIPVNAS